MRVLVISNLYPPDVVGGYEVACAQMSRELANRGHTVRVLTSTTPLAGDADGVHRVLEFVDALDPRLTSRTHPTLRRAAVLRSAGVHAGNVALLRREVLEFGPDVVYLNHLLGLGGVGIALAVHLAGLPWVWHLLDAVPIQLTAAFGSSGRGLAAIAGRHLDGSWIACSSGLVEEVRRGGMELRGPLEVMEIWRVGGPASPRSAYYRPGRPLRCVVSCRLEAEKGVDILIDAVHRLQGTGAGPITVDICGDGPQRSALETQVRRLQLGSLVHFMGLVPQPDMMERLRAADVMLFPTEPREPSGVAALEAAGEGCVPLVTGGAGITEWLVDGVHLLTAERRADAFAGRLAGILDGTIALEPISRRAQAAVNEGMLISHVAPKVERVLAAAAARGSSVRQPVSWERLVRTARIAEHLGSQLTGAAR